MGRADIRVAGGNLGLSRRRREGPSPVTIILYALIALMFLKLLGILPGSPQYETVNVVLGVIGLALSIITAFQEWLRGKFRGLEDSISELTETLHDVERRLTTLEAELKSVRLAERLARLEERLH